MIMSLVGINDSREDKDQEKYHPSGRNESVVGDNQKRTEFIGQMSKVTLARLADDC